MIPGQCVQSRHGAVIAMLFATFLALTGCQAQPRPSESARASLDELLILIDQRLAVAPLVARAKWNSRAPIDDPAREAQILAGVTAQAQRAGVEPALAGAFFQSQFEAGKLIQRALHEQWRREGRPPFADAPDLARDVRPVLDALTPRLIASLRAAQPLLADSAARAYLVERGAVVIRDDSGGAVRAEALRALTPARR